MPSAALPFRRSPKAERPGADPPAAVAATLAASIGVPRPTAASRVDRAELRVAIAALGGTSLQTSHDSDEAQCCREALHAH